ncbi:GLPGLI family protein [Flavobacterium urocaniciphilum]|uniref:GLPGLI family protein n=1 Tax=Flavobacterium urocaniciphilum TaxID=1299341 RepID=A0A1H9BM40_9FLAO|nr:GLPGLI family protein [Flavobacterium urocaniciphilum]SEP89801.1 GLPGLI family protein [Flavobacterium urocaniciphilum]
MRKIYCLLFLTIFISVKSQNVIVTYGVELQDEKELFKNNQNLRNLFEEAKLNAPTFRFKLTINDSISNFTQIKSITFGQTSTSTLGYLSFFSYTGESFSDKDSIYSQSLLFGSKTFVKKPLKSNWVLTTETKTIENFKCYKATNIYEVTNGLKTFKHPVTAWYCPEIPLQFGPNGYGNLPGLILELQVRNHVYGAKSINLNSNETVTFDKEKLTIIDEKEFEEKIKKLQEQ